MRRRPSTNSRARLFLAWALFAGLAPPPARAAPAPARDVAQLTLPLQLEVFLNGHPTSLIAGFILEPGGRISAKRSELGDVGIKAPGEGGPDMVVALDDAPGLTYRYDEQKQSIHIEAPEELLLGREYHARGAPDNDRPPLRKGFGAVVNYDLFTSTISPINTLRPSYQGASATLDTRLFSPYGTLTQSGIAGSTLARRTNLLRLNTTFSYSDADSLRTYNVGDTISSGLAWTRPIRMAGVQVQRNFGLRPDLITLPLPIISGSAAVPSTLDVYVNNVKTYSQEVAPGSYRINDLPLTGGGTAHVVMHDSTGRRIEKDLQFFASRLLMRPGFTDYSVEVGAPRRGFGVDSFDYSRTPVANASLRHGVYDWLTAEAHAEASPKLANVGVGLVARLFDRAVLGGSIVGSRSSFGSGLQLYGSFETQYRGFVVNLTTQRTLGRYDDLASITSSLSPKNFGYSVANGGAWDSFAFLTSARPPRELDRISIGAPLPFDKSTLGFAFTRLVQANVGTSLIGSVSWSRNIFFDASVFLSAYTNIGSRRQSGIFAGLTVPLGPKIVASMGATSGAGGYVVSTDVSRALDLEDGSYGYRLHDSEGNYHNALRSAAGSYRSRWARFHAGVSQQGKSATGAFEAVGAVATLGNGVFFSNRIDDAFAVVDAAAPDVAVYQENRLVGRTDSSGRLLVPYLRSYQRNNISIDTSNLPVNADAEATQQTVVPAYRNGVRVDFGVRPQVAGAVVILHGPDGKPIKPGLGGVVEGSNEKFVVGYDGRAYVTGLAASNTARVSFGLSECRASFDYAPSQNSQVVIGPVVCR